MRPPKPDPLPLRVDVINGWPLMEPTHAAVFKAVMGVISGPAVPLFKQELF